MSLTPDDLKAIGELLDQRLDQKLKPFEKRLEGIEGKLALLTEDMAGFFHKTWEMMDKDRKETKELEGRVTRLEGHTGLAKQN